MDTKAVIREHMSQLGRKGGKANTDAQNVARRKNGKLGGRPRKPILSPKNKS